MSDMHLDDCGGCEGIRALTPAEMTNSPGLPSITYRVGTYSSFRQSMIARLSSDTNQLALSGLKTRSGDDFSLALLDAWAIVCDVLTFYQERIANESYSRTSTDRASLLQLARSVSYELRPGVAADTHLVFTLEDTPGSPGKALIDIGTKVQSLPNPGEKPQVFETIEAIEAFAAWNALQPRKTRPQPLSVNIPSIVFSGISTNLRPGHMLLIIAPPADSGPDKAVRRVRRVVVDVAKQQTTAYLEDAVLREPPTSGGSAASADGPQATLPPLATPSSGSSDNGSHVNGSPGAGGVGVAVSSLVASSSVAASGYQVLSNTVVGTILQSKEWNLRDLNALATIENWSVKDILANAAVQSQIDAATRAFVATEDETGVYVLRTQVAIFGNNAPDWQSMPDSVRKVYYNNYKAVNPDDPRSINDFDDWPFVSTVPSIIVAGTSGPATPPHDTLDLDRTYPQFLNKSWVVVVRPDDNIIIAQIDSNTETSVVNYTLSARVARLKLETMMNAAPQSMQDVRQMTVYGQSEKLTLADLSLDTPVQGNTIEIPGLFGELAPGRTFMLTGEIANLNGVRTSEIVTLKNISYETSFPGGLTKFTLEQDLVNTYKPETVTIYGNVTRAMQGETVQDEILGDGDASQAYQRFTLRQAPLTYVHDKTPTGIVSTLKVYVNGIQWQEVPTLVGHGPRDHVFVTHTTDDGKTVVQFGDGQTGARLPDGQENVRATYRKGSGSQGHVNAGQLTQLMTRPLGVKSVTNLLAPTGAEDPESTDEARNNASLTVLTLNRIVSVQDYENLARSFVGVAKAQATAIARSNVRGVFVTLADTNGNEISVDDQLYKKVFFAMRSASDPSIQFTLLSYKKLLFRLSAQIRVEADFALSDVLVAVQQTMRSHFSFENRSFGQSVTRKEVTTVIQDVPGVATAYLLTLYRVGTVAQLNEELYAALPTVGQDGTVSPAELLMADTIPFDALEVIP